MSDPQPVVVAIDFTPEEVRLALAPLGGAPLLREAYPLPANVHDEAA